MKKACGTTNFANYRVASIEIEINFIKFLDCYMYVFLLTKCYFKIKHDNGFDKMKKEKKGIVCSRIWLERVIIRKSRIASYD
jgi:hypothetical protein